jgi:hypothetical protein
MTWSAIKSAWESGRLVFRRKSDGAGIMAINPSRLTRFMSVTAIETDDDTITAAMIKAGIITYAGDCAGGTLTFDTGANIDAAFPTIEVGEVIKFYIQNVGTVTATLADDDCPATVTVVDAAQTIAANEGAIVLLRKTAAGEFDAYIVGA